MLCQQTTVFQRLQIQLLQLLRATILVAGGFSFVARGIYIPAQCVRGPFPGLAMAPGGHAVINTIHHHQGLCD